MALYRPTQLQSYLDQLQTKAKKHLSQNFLIDGNILNKIIATANVSKEDHIVEIGPGPGALTEALLKKGASVLAIETDPIFAQGLEDQQTENNRLRILNEDALKLSWEEVLEPSEKKWKVVANLPYQITTPLLAILLPLSHKIESLTLMVQKEVAMRIVATARSKDYSRLSILTHFYSKAKLSFSVSPHCFTPKPKVTSAVVHLELRPPPLVTNKTAFFDMIRLAFGQKRKMLRATLGDHFGKEHVKKSLLALSLPEGSRPQELSLETFIELFETLSE